MAKTNKINICWKYLYSYILFDSPEGLPLEDKVKVHRVHIPPVVEIHQEVAGASSGVGGWLLTPPGKNFIVKNFGKNRRSNSGKSPF
jgi:hypothetical protein